MARDFAQLADVATHINGRMLFLLKQAEEDDLLNGSGNHLRRLINEVTRRGISVAAGTLIHGA